MKKLICKVLVFMAIVLSITLIINKIYLRKTSGDIEDNSDYFKMPDEIEVCNFGSSHGYYGFDYEEYSSDYTCFNFAMTSQSLSYDDRILHCYMDKLNKGDCTAYIVISYFSLYGIPEDKAEDFESKNLRYYSILPSRYIKDYDQDTAITAKLKKTAPSLFSYQVLPAVLLKKDEELSTDKWGTGTAEDDGFDLKFDANEAYKRHLVTNKIDASGHLIKNQEEIEALRDIISTCKQNDIKPVLVTTPYTKEYTDVIEESMPEFYKEFSDDVNEIVADTGAEYYDYSHDDEFQKDYSLFMNADHLSKAGAKKFTGLLMQRTEDLLK